MELVLFVHSRTEGYGDSILINLHRGPGSYFSFFVYLSPLTTFRGESFGPYIPSSAIVLSSLEGLPANGATTGHTAHLHKNRSYQYTTYKQGDFDQKKNTTCNI